jgi:serine/threonine protein kinase/tetratricopeptide (TPR) repeat protein
MTSARWEAITKIFEAALDKEPSRRIDFVKEACAGDLDLEGEVHKLLAADEGAGSFLERPALDSLPSLPSLDSEPLLLSSGTLISGRFEILDFIGQGGMGQVYKVQDLELKERVALKTIRPEISSDPTILSRFRREVQLTRRITHPNVCRTFDIEHHTSAVGDGVEKDFIFLTMELLEGETLAEFLRRRGRLTAAEALPLVVQMVEALTAAHSVGVVHRDFKPSNVVLVPSNTGLRLVVTDFGLAHAVTPDGEMSAEQIANSSRGWMGTLAYMAPEQLERGEATTASDIYALGLVMYEMVTGHRPFEDPVPFAEAVKRIKQVAPSPKLLVPDLDAHWESVVSKCLAMESGARFESVRGVTETLKGARENREGGAQAQRWRKGPEHVGGMSRVPNRLLHKGTIGIAVCLLAMALFGAVLRHYLVRPDPRLGGGSTMLLTDVRNTTEDQRFDGTTELVRQQLSQSPFFSLLDGPRMQDVLEQMNKARNSPLEPVTAREVALRSGAARVIYGNVSRIGDNYVLDIAIEQPDNNPRRSRAEWGNRWTWSMPSQTSEKEIPKGFLKAVRDAGDWIRSEVGEAGSDIAAINAPPEDVTTGNWAALSEFSQAEKFKAAGQPDNAIVALHNAVAEDPGFALAYMRLGDLLVSLNRYEEGYRAYQLALVQEQQERLTRREKDRLKGIYAHDREDFKTAEAAFHEYTVYYPNDYIGWFYRSYPLMMMGRPEEAIASLKQAARIDPNRMFAPAHIARFALILANFEDASKWIQQLRDKGYVDDANLVEGESEFLQDRYPAAQVHFENLEASKDSLYRSYGYSLLARLFAELGQYQKAVQVLSQGIAADLESGDAVHRADKLLDRAYLNFKRRRYDGCLQDIKTALALDRSPQRSLVAGTLLGRVASETSRNEKKQFVSVLRGIERTLQAQEFAPLSQIVQARLRGELLLAGSDWKGAIQEFKKADALEAPAKDREYLARASLEAARQTTDGLEAAQLIRSGLAAYSFVVLKPGQIWQWALDYPPGYVSDEMFSFIKAASQVGVLDGGTKEVLRRYLLRRANADDDVPDVQAARGLESRLKVAVPN